MSAETRACSTSVRRFARQLSLLFALLLVAAQAAADVFQSGQFRLQVGDAPGTYALTAQLPATMARSTTIAWPAGCRQTELRQQVLGERVLVLVRATCERPLGRDDVIRTPWRLGGARLGSDLTGKTSTLTLTSDGAGIAIPLGAVGGDRGWVRLAPEMLWQGMRHIGNGWDHLAFVLCLCMLFRGLPLLGLVSAFTVGHSISLGLAFFDVLRLPVPPVEALIALSIVLVAREGLLVGEGSRRGDTLQRSLALVVVFGLVHGLGFASALGELGIAAGERWPALVFFNVGVELGQIAFVVLVLAVLSGLRSMALAPIARRIALYAAGVTGSYWLIDRIASFPLA